MIINKYDPEEHKRVKKLQVGVLCVITFLSTCAFSQMSPFYPIKAKQKGVTVGWVGFVIGTMAVFQIMSSYIIGKKMNKIGGGRTTVVFVATFLIIS
jgi:hypothetical protein